MFDLVANAIVDRLSSSKHHASPIKRAMTHPKLTRLVTPVRAYLLDLTSEALFLFFGDLSERYIGYVNHALVLGSVGQLSWYATSARGF